MSLLRHCFLVGPKYMFQCFMYETAAVAFAGMSFNFSKLNIIFANHDTSVVLQTAVWQRFHPIRRQLWPVPVWHSSASRTQTKKFAGISVLRVVRSRSCYTTVTSWNRTCQAGFPSMPNHQGAVDYRSATSSSATVEHTAAGSRSPSLSSCIFSSPYTVSEFTVVHSSYHQV